MSLMPFDMIKARHSMLRLNIENTLCQNISSLAVVYNKNGALHLNFSIFDQINRIVIKTIKHPVLSIVPCFNMRLHFYFHPKIRNSYYNYNTSSDFISDMR